MIPALLASEVPGLGTADLGNLYAALSDDEAEAVLQAAWDGGVRHFDTAPHYGLGLAEERLGRFLARQPTGSYLVSTKAGRLLRPAGATAGRDPEGFDVPPTRTRVWDLSRDGLRRSLEESLSRLGLPRVDVLYLHDPERATGTEPVERALGSLLALREAGLVDAVGVGSMDVAALAQAATHPLDLLMCGGRFTLLEQPAADVVLPRCRANGIGVVAASVFNSGLLATDAADGRYDYGAAGAEVRARAARLAEVCREHAVPLPVAALAFPRREAAVVATLIAGRTPEQIVQNLRAARTAVPEALWQQLAAEGLIPA